MTPEQRAAIERANARIAQQSTNQIPQSRAQLTPEQTQAIQRANARLALQGERDQYGVPLNLSGQAQLSEAPPAPTTFESYRAGIERGLRNIGQSTKQLFLQITDPQQAQEYTQEVNKEIQAYNRRYNPPEYRDGQLVGASDMLDVPQIIGEALPYAVGGAALGGAKAGAGLLSNVLRGAAAGAVPAALTYTPSGELSDRATNAVVGAIGGGVLSGVAQPVARGTIAAAQTSKKLASQAKRQFSDKTPLDEFINEKKIANEPVLELEKGISEKTKNLLDADFYKLSLQEQLKKQINETGQINAEQAARAANIKRVTGLDATKAQITRDPSDWTREQNLSKEALNLEEGSMLSNRYSMQDQNAQKYARDLAAKIADVNPDQMPASNFQAATRAIDAIKKIDSGEQKEVTALYNAFRESDVQAMVPTSRVSTVAAELIDDFGEENIPSAVRRRLDEFGFLGNEVKKEFTVKEADKLSKLINNNLNPADRPSFAALTQLKKSVDESLFDIPDEQLAAAPLLRQARDRAKQRFADRESSTALIKALDDVPADRFVERFVTGGNVEDILALKNYLQKTKEGQQAWDILKGRAWESIVDDVTRGGEARFQPTVLRNRLRKLGVDRMQAIWNPDELEAIASVNNAINDMFATVDFSAPNFSGTASALMGALANRAQMVPVLGTVVQPMRQAVEESTKRSAARSALMGEGAASAAFDAQRQMQLQSLLRRQTPAVGAVGGVTAIDLTRQRQQ